MLWCFCYKIIHVSNWRNVEPNVSAAKQIFFFAENKIGLYTHLHQVRTGISILSIGTLLSKCTIVCTTYCEYKTPSDRLNYHQTEKKLTEDKTYTGCTKGNTPLPHPYMRWTLEIPSIPHQLLAERRHGITTTLLQHHYNILQFSRLAIL